MCREGGCAVNRQEIAIVVLLFLLLVGWGFHQKKVSRQRSVDMQEERAGAAEGAVTESAPAPPVATQAVERVERGGPVARVPEKPPQAAGAPVKQAAEQHSAPEERLTLANEMLEVVVSSWGGGIALASLLEYPQIQVEDSGPVRLDFSSRQALSLEGIPGLSTNADFHISPAPTGNGVHVRRTTGDGLVFGRQISLLDDYLIEIYDTFTNEGESAFVLPSASMAVGPMLSVQSKAKTRGMSYLGIDTLADQGGARVRYWGKKGLPGLFGGGGGGCQRRSTVGMPMRVSHRLGAPVLWVAAKNKFFVQILAPEGGASDCELQAGRDVVNSNAFSIATVSAAVALPECVVAPGESVERTVRYYVGPKKYSLLKELGNRQEEVMQFGWLSWLCKKLLWILNFLYGIIPNYGIAIILLTIIVRLVFWPVTRKSTESMKKMQKIQPEVTKLREKHKDNPQKMNQAVMALYKEHKVNPMMGCLPMVVQIPVFIALFTVLRSAVELRFARFLWIKDLSEPEGLLAGMLPFVQSLNVLPLFMTATMVLQQQLTPTSGDPQQKKMMMFMPVIFLFLFYNMASALVLYWSVSQCLAIVQLLLQRRKANA